MKRILATVSLVALAAGLSGAALAGKDKDRDRDRGEKRRHSSYIPAATHDFREPSAEKVELGRNLMFDKILSGNKNISCGTCHHSLAGTGDGLSLPVGEGGTGIGITRAAGDIVERVPRNAPPVFNLGDRSFHTLFHDGRVTTLGAGDFPNGCETPAGHGLPTGLENVLACQAMFPVTSATEMAGQVREDGTAENDVAGAAAVGDLAMVWELLAQRLRDPDNGYVELFEAAYPDIAAGGQITYVHAANAIAAFEGTQWRCDDSPFDRYVRGNHQAMSGDAVKGMRLFYRNKGNQAACGDCHSGIYQTDHDFHAIAMPQIGAGRGSNGEGRTGGHEDFGREQVTTNPADTLKFRTPSLRMVVDTAPYGHSGAYNTLRAVVEHHIDPEAGLRAYNPQAVLPTHPDLDGENYIAMQDPAIVNYIAAFNELEPMRYSDRDVDLIMEFLNALTDQSCLDFRSDFDVVNGVPSGLPLAD